MDENSREYIREFGYETLGMSAEQAETYCDMLAAKHGMTRADVECAMARVKAARAALARAIRDGGAA